MSPKHKKTFSSSKHALNVVIKKNKKKEAIRKKLKTFLQKYNFLISEADNNHNIKDWLMKKDINGNSPLFVGCQLEREVQLSLHMIEIYPYAIKQKGWSGNINPLHLACAYNKLNLLIQLLQINSKLIHYMDMNGRSPLFYACKNQCLDVIRYLITQTDIDVNAKDSSNKTAFHYSCDIGKFDACNELLNSQMLHAENVDKYDNTPLFSLIISMIQGKKLSRYNNSAFIIKKILLKFPNSINYRTKDGCNILHKIIVNSNNEKMLSKLYWEYMISINRKLIDEIDSDNGFTPIHYACIYSNVFPSFILKTSMVKTRKFNPCFLINKLDKSGQSAFHLACKMHKFSAFLELINCEKINIEITDIFGNTVLHALVDDMPSITHHSASMVNMILEKSPYMVTCKNYKKRTAIDMVYRHIEYATELIEFGNSTAKHDRKILIEILQNLQDHLLKARIQMFQYLLFNNNLNL
jgi:ankyrin repeat protein